MRAGLLSALVLVASVLGSAEARADDPPKRPVPDYEGRPPPPDTPGEIALWVPRVVFSPVYFTAEYVLRAPIGALITAAERSNVPQVLYDFFAFGPEHKAGIAPIAFIDFGFNPSVGLFGFWNDAFFKGDDLSVHASAWTNDWLGGSLVQRIHFRNKKDSVQFRLLGVRRPDHVFYGIGPTTLESARSRYSQDRIEGGALVDFDLWRASKIEAGVGLRSSSFNNGHYGDDPGIFQSVAAGTFPLPDGFARGYTAEVNDLSVTLDSRRPFPDEGSGIRLAAQAEQGSDLRQSPGSGWMHYAGSAGGFLDIDGHRRVVSLTALTIFSDPLGSRPVPFTELATVGGDIPTPGSFPVTMQGFYPGRLVDRSAAVATLQYKWPIGPWISGSMTAAVGNVFGEHLEGFDTRLLRFSGTIGLESDSSLDNNFDVVVGFGTETFEHGTQVDSIRVALGVSRF
jgi:hypothetical protein